MVENFHNLPHKPTFHRLDGPVTEKFDCGDEEQNDFLVKSAWDHQQAQYSVTYLAYVGGMLAGYVTLALGEIELEGMERPADAPFARIGALKLAQMGVDTRYQGQGLGRLLVDFAILRARALSKTEAGCRYVILDAKPAAERLYRKVGFVENQSTQQKRMKRAKRDARIPPLSMRFDIREFQAKANEADLVATPRNTAGTIGGLIGFLVETFSRMRR